MPAAALAHRHPHSPAPHCLRRWHMVADGNSHRPDLCPSQPGLTQAFMLSEALLPQIRTLACLIAAEHLDPHSPTPAQITTEADWFAARILLLRVRVFHLDVTLIPMLKTANCRAQAYARRHGWHFVPAHMRMSLHAGRPQHLLIMESADPGDADLGLIGNSLRLRQQLAAQTPW